MSKYAIKIADDGRIEYATFEEFATDDCILVDSLPEDGIAYYSYINGEFVKNIEPETIAVPLSVEERLAKLENSLSVEDFVVGKWYYRGDRVKFDGKTYVCIAPAETVCVWSPADYAVYWKEV